MFQPFPKIARLSREVIVTEKLDGTNAQVIIVDPEQLEGEEYERTQQGNPLFVSDEGLQLYAGSRTRLITPGKQTDNYGFAGWVKDNAQELMRLGEGRHFGEWYGKGINRNYGLSEKRFALFNTVRWRSDDLFDQAPPTCCDVVPVLWRGDFCSDDIAVAFDALGRDGSVAAPGFMNPEGIIVYHTAAKVCFKQTFDNEDGKWAA
jgi:hypothetical protein